MSQEDIKRLGIFIVAALLVGAAICFSFIDSTMNPPIIADTIEAREIAKDAIKKFEGLRHKAYVDGSGYSIGYGHGGAKEGQQCTLAEAEAWLNLDINHAEEIIDELVSVPISTGQRAALISFIFNFNRSKFKNSTLYAKLNAGKYNKVPGELERWIYGLDQDGDGEKDILPGLQVRRAWEIEMWNM